MAVYGLSVTKTMPFRGATEDFSNVYHYWFVPGGATMGNLNAMIDSIVSAEKAVFANNVTFKSARVWGPVGDPATSVTQIIRDLTGTGNQASGSMYREAAFVVAWPLARSASTGRKRYLRKYLHLLNPLGGTADVQNGSAIIPATSKSTILNSYANVIDDVNWGWGGVLCAPNGDTPTGDPYVLDYIRTRQLKQ